MKIERGRSVSPSGGPRRASGAAGGSEFTPTVENAPRAAAVAGPAPVASLDAILALQTEEGPTQRRARQARRGRAALDALEHLEQGLLLGRAPGALVGELQRLRAAAEPTGEAGLDDILREIDTRVAVELAKLERVQAKI